MADDARGNLLALSRVPSVIRVALTHFLVVVFAIVITAVAAGAVRLFIATFATAFVVSL